MVEVLTVDFRRSTGEQTKQTNKNHVINQSFIRVSYFRFPPLLPEQKNVGLELSSGISGMGMGIPCISGMPWPWWVRRYRSLKFVGFVPRGTCRFPTKSHKIQSRGEIRPTDMYIYMYIYICIYLIYRYVKKPGIIFTPELGAKHSKSEFSIICMSSAFLPVVTCQYFSCWVSVHGFFGCQHETCREM